MRRFNGFLPAALTVTVGILATGMSLVWQRTADAMPSDNTKDVQKSAKPGNRADQTKAREAKIVPSIRASHWREKLDQDVTLEFEPNTPLKEALSHIGERYGLTMLVDVNAFRTDMNFDDVGASPVKLPRLVNVKLRTVLRETLRQVEGDFYTKDDVLMVVPRKQIESGVVLRQSIDVVLEKRPLAEALNELADMSGASIVLDVQRLKDPKFEVSADFHNVALQDAVRVLADMAGMKSVVMGNLLYVTSPGNADNLEKEKTQPRSATPPKWEKVAPKEKK
jgi:hypothetical protein